VFLPNSGMIVGGCVVTTIGLILAWQNQTGLWATWAWVWAFIPVASGVGSLLGGLRTGDRSMRDAGLWQIVIGLALLAVFYLFFEQFIGLSGGQVPVPEWAMPVVLVGLGVLILLRGVFGPRETDQPA
jgi:O-antigen/teichoic acid export membrane protein